MGLGHPKHFLNTIPKELGRAISHIASSSMVSLARERTQSARPWMLRDMQLKEDECNFKKTLSDHCSEVLRNKKVLVVDEMIKCSGYGDKNIAKDISAGFDLMGTLPSSNAFEAKSTFGKPFSIRRGTSTTGMLRARSAE